MPQGPHSQPPMQAHVPQEAPRQAPSQASDIGFSVTLSEAQRDNAIKACALEHAKTKGVTIPSNEVDFCQRAEVHWLKDGRVAVTLEV